MEGHTYIHTDPCIELRYAQLIKIKIWDEVTLLMHAQTRV